MIELKEYAAKTHQGPFLQINEDDFMIDVPNGLFLIFDGFGGSGVGDKVVALLKDEIRNSYTRFDRDPDATFPFSYSYKYLIEGNALINALYFAHLKIKTLNSEQVMLSNRGGASGIGVALAENILTISSTGNCISYLYRKGHLNVLTYPETLRMLSKEDSNLQFHTCPMSGFGLFDDLYLQTRELRIATDDVIVMMTDGAYSRIAEDELKYLIETKQENALKIQNLFDLSNDRGNLDNQTAVVLRF